MSMTLYPSSLPSTLSNPITPFLLSLLTYIFVLGFTQQTSSIRTSALPLMIGYLYFSLTLPYNKDQFNHPIYPNLLGGSTCSMLLQYIDTILIRKVSFDNFSPPTPQKTRRGRTLARTPLAVDLVWQRFLFGFSSVFSSRGLGTPGEVKNLPPFSLSDPDYIPSRARFLGTKATQCLIHLLILDLSSLGARSPTDPDVFGSDHVPFLTRLHAVSAEEIALRVITSMATGIVTYSLFQAIYCFLAFVTVALGLSDRASWRPLYCSPLDAWSIRQFWGAFWHQALRLKLSTPSQYLTYKVLRLRRGSFVGRYLAVFLTFAMSGLLHLCGDVAAGIHWRESGVLQFYCTQALGVVIEDRAQALYHYFERGRRKRQPAQRPMKRLDPAQKVSRIAKEVPSNGVNQRPALWKRLIGYLWVIVWMVWSMPVWTYPVSQRNKGEGVLPFGFLRHFI